jgi:3-dehydroquinate synthase
MAPAADAERLCRLLERLGLPTAVPAGLDRQRLLDHMRLDKKNRSGTLRLILWQRLGAAEIVSGVSEAQVLATLADTQQP